MRYLPLEILPSFFQFWDSHILQGQEIALHVVLYIHVYAHIYKPKSV